MTPFHTTVTGVPMAHTALADDVWSERREWFDALPYARKVFWELKWGAILAERDVPKPKPQRDYVNMPEIVPAREAFYRELNIIRANTNNRVIVEATDSLTLLSMAFWPDEKTDDAAAIDRWRSYGFDHAQTRIMELLFSKIGRSVSYNSFMSYLFFDRNANAWPEPKVIQVQICRMRRKIAKSPYRIDTIWGIGYRMELAV